jgi:hypothetical protein
MRALLTVLVFLAACQRANPAYRGPHSEGPVEAPNEMMEVHPVVPDARAPADARTPVGSPDAAPSKGALDATAFDGPPAEVAPGSAGSALLVVGALDLDPMDVQHAERLEALGFGVTLALDSQVVTADASGRSLVVVSGSTSSNEVGDKFKNVPVPVICNDSWGFPKLGLTGAAPALDWGRDDGDAPPGASLAFPSPHPLGANLSGVVAISDRPIGLAWGRPLNGAISVATLVGDNTRVTLFGYLAGVRLADGNGAPARRVGSFVRHPNGARLTANGLRLFDAMVTWAAGR